MSMINLGMEPRPSSSGTAEKAMSFISKGWRDVRDSAGADLRLMRARASSFKNIADRELENFLNSASSSLATAPSPSPDSALAEFEFVKRIRPKISEIRRAYSSPDFSRKVLERWTPRASIRIDLSSIRNAIVSEVDEMKGVLDFERERARGWRGVNWRGEVEEEEEGKEWEPIRQLKTLVRDLERKSQASEIFGSFKSSEFVEKVKLSLRSIYKEPQQSKGPFGSQVELGSGSQTTEVAFKYFPYKSKNNLCRPLQLSKWLEWREKAIMTSPVFTVPAITEYLGTPKVGTKQEVPPLDLPELMAYLVKQSGPWFDQLGIKKDVCDKIVEALCSRRKDHLLSHSLSSMESFENGNISDELDLRIASVLQSTGHHYEGGFWTDSVKRGPTDNKRHVAIVTTASLPWMTGTAVNPLFRAAYLAKSAKQNVTLVVPWLCKSDQELVYPNSMTFGSPEEQEIYIRSWLEERVGFKADFKISFYPGKFSKQRRSILPAGDTSQFVSSKDADIAILEEPEHLNWYHHGKRWTDKFNHVIGIVHTNYLEYIKREKNGALQAFLVKHVNNWITRAHCDKVLRLSAATQDLPKSVICNVHGVNRKFLEVGEKVAVERECGQQAFSKGAYFLGKMVWAKGYRELIDLLAKHKTELEGFKLDVYGNGEDSQEVQSTAKKLQLNLNFLKGRDHADDSIHGYKVFINPSVSDVLCTATAEALAMGKFVICADHPSNEFFRAFPNCLTYRTSDDFVARVKEALSNEPHPLTPEQRYNLSWEAATQRFMEYSDLDKVLNNQKGLTDSGKRANTKISKSVSMPSLSEVVDGGLAFAHYCFSGNEVLRLATGAIPGTINYDKQHCTDMHLLPPQVQNPIYGW